VIITNSTQDKFYFEQLLAFLASIKVNSPKHKVTVFLANYDLDKVQKLRRGFPWCVFEDRKLTMVKDKRFSLIIFRSGLIKECFDKYKEPVAWIDTDVLVRNDLSEFLDVGPNQLKILKRQTPKEKNQYDAPINAGIFNIGYSEHTYKIINKWHKGNLATPKWGQGQIELWKAYNKYSKRVELVSLPLKFNDLGDRNNQNMFADNSVMWHCKSNHFDNPKYQSEYQLYLKFGKELYYG